jgi:hypothetical protein
MITKVETLVFVRHGEKPKKDQDVGQLTCKGFNRALALPMVLIKDKNYGKPDYLFAPTPRQRCLSGGGQFSYTRPLMTIEPTAIRLGMSVNTQFDVTDIDGLHDELSRNKYENAIVFIAWEHKELVKLVKKLVQVNGGDPSKVPDWDDSDYDSIYVLRISQSDGAKSISFSQDCEDLNNSSDKCPEVKPP